MPRFEPQASSPGRRTSRRRTPRSWAVSFAASCERAGSPPTTWRLAWRPSGCWPRRSKRLRPTPEALAGMLSIQAERAFSLNADEMVFDYCGKASTSQKSQVLLLAAPRQIVNQIKAITDAAGLTCQSVTVSALACGGASCDADPTYRVGLYARPTYCEFWGQSDGSPRFVKHVADGAGWDAGRLRGPAELHDPTTGAVVLRAGPVAAVPDHGLRHLRPGGRRSPSRQRAAPAPNHGA